MMVAVTSAAYLAWLALPLGVDDAHRNVVLAGLARVDEIEGAYRDGDQIAGQRAGGREDHLLHAVGLVGFGDGRGIGDGGVIFRDVDRNLPGRFEIGLIEAGKGAARVDAFELGEEVRLFAVEPLEDAGAALLADLALVDDVDARCAGARILAARRPTKSSLPGSMVAGCAGDGGLLGW